jgi:predicted transcriptional regulator
METDKIHERVLEIQKSIETANPQQQGLMLGELLEIVSQIEQSLAEVKLDISEIENQINDEE